MKVIAQRPASLDDFLAQPEGERFAELIAGELIPKAPPSGEHGDAQAGVVGTVRPAFQRKAGAGGPGGWWIVTEVEVLLDNGDVVRPDVLGWRRERCPERPIGIPVTVRPDWICEIVSPRTPRTTPSRSYVSIIKRTSPTTGSSTLEIPRSPSCDGPKTVS
jgi:Uma2 family endonuclease